MDGKPNIFARLGMAANALVRGGIAQAVEHFRRAGKLGGPRADAGPSSPYEQVVAFFRCVEFLASAPSQFRFCVSTINDDIIESGPIAALLDKPNPRQSIDEFMGDTIGWLMMTGEAYWVFTSRAGTRPTEMLPVGPAQIKPRFEQRGREVGHPIGWKFRMAGDRWDQAIDLDLDEVWPMSIRGFDPDRPWKGVGVADVARKAINQVFKSDVANEASLDNGVEPGGVFTMDGTPTKPQGDDLREEVNQRHAGAQNRRRHMILYGGIKYTQTAANFKDMEFRSLKLFSRADVCAAFGLDPSAVGFPPEGGRFEYAESAEAKAWRSRVDPLLRWLASQFGRGVLAHYEEDKSLAMRDALKRTQPMNLRQRVMHGASKSLRTRRETRAASGGRRLFAWFDTSSHEAFLPVIKEKTEVMSRMVSDLKATPQEASDLVDGGLAGNPAQQVAWQKVGEMPVGELPPGEDDPPGSEDGDVDANSDDGQAHAPPAHNKEHDELPGGAERADEERLRRLWSKWRGSYAPIEKQFRSSLTGHYQRLRREVLSNLDNVQFGADAGDTIVLPVRWIDEDEVKRERAYRITPTQRDVIGEILFDLFAANNRLRARLSPLVREAFRLGGQQSMDEAAEAQGQAPEDADVFNIADPEAKAALRRREQRIVDINKRTAQRLRASLAEGFQAGENQQQLADRVRSQFNRENTRARAIAFTETSSAVEESRAQGRDQANVPLKSWLSSRKETGRPEHAAVEAQTMANPIPQDEQFDVAGHPAAYPKAPTLPVGQVVNCGCTTLSRFPGDSLDKALDRFERVGCLHYSALQRQSAGKSAERARTEWSPYE